MWTKLSTASIKFSEFKKKFIFLSIEEQHVELGANLLWTFLRFVEN